MIVTNHHEIFVHATTTSTSPEPMKIESSSSSSSLEGTTAATKGNTLVKITSGTPQRLDLSYTPGEYDVICARGKFAWNHPGNKYFRSLIKKYQDQFGYAKTRLERTTVVTNIVDKIRSKGMGFVKQDEKDGHYWQIGDRLSREKVGTLLRDSQGTRYSSSSQAKKRRRKVTTVVNSNTTQHIVMSNPFIAETLANLTQDLASSSCFGKSSSQELTNDELVDMFTQANCQMLETIKQDKPMLQRFNDAMSISDNNSSCKSDDDETASLQDDECCSMAME